MQSRTLKTLDDMKADILAQLKPQKAREAVSAMVDKSKVDMNDAFFGPAAPAAPVAPAPGK